MLVKIRERSLKGSGSVPRLDGTAKASPREFAPLRVEDHPAMTVAGVRGHFLTGGDPAIASQWTRFLPHVDEVPGRVGRSAFGVCWVGPAGGLDYMSAVEVSASTEVPLELIEEHIPATTYAVFAHTGHVLEIPKTMHKALEWIGREGKVMRQEEGLPTLIEHYGEGFDAKTGKGDIELWIPVRK
jgi:AraC family transcriptional regulator